VSAVTQQQSESASQLRARLQDVETALQRQASAVLDSDSMIKARMKALEDYI